MWKAMEMASPVDLLVWYAYWRVSRVAGITALRY